MAARPGYQPASFAAGKRGRTRRGALHGGARTRRRKPHYWPGYLAYTEERLGGMPFDQWTRSQQIIFENFVLMRARGVQDTTPNGPLAKWLVMIGHRPRSEQREVGSY